MANRYAVGASPMVWDGTAGTKWSTTSGGAGGAAVPTSSDDVIFDANSPAVITQAGPRTCRSFDTTNYTGSFTPSAAITVANDITIGAGMTLVTGSGSFSITGTCLLTTNGQPIPAINISSTATSVTFQDDVTSISSFVFNSGLLDFNGFDLQCAVFVSLGGQTRELRIGSSTLRMVSNGNATTPLFSTSTESAMTLTTSSGAQLIFNGVNADGECGLSSGLNFQCPIIFPTRRLIVLAGTPTFSDTIEIDVSGCRIELQSNINLSPDFIFDNTVTNGLWNILTSDIPGTQRNIIQASGERSFNNIAFQDINFTGGATFTAENSLNLGNVDGIEIDGQTLIPRGEDYFLFAETSGPTPENPFGTSSED